MIPPDFDSRETVGVIHSFMEKWSIIFFVILVICDVILHLFGEKSGPTWSIGWEKKTRLILRGKHSLTLRFPAYSGTLGLKSLMKLLGIISFGLAITLEVIGYPYGKRNDELANKEIASSQAQASEALRKASVAAAQTAGLQREAESLKEQAEDERLKRVEIEERVAWRRLTKQQQIQIGSRLRSFSGETGNLYFVSGDTEGITFALDIASAFRVAQWRVKGPTSFFFGWLPPPPTGVFVGSTGDLLSVHAADVLVRELKNLGFECTKESPSAPPSGPPSYPFVSVKIGPRPEGPQGKSKLKQQHEISSRQQTNK